MTFLTPIPMLVGAAVALPALIAFYLLRLRRRPVRVSSTMLWESAVRDLEANVPLRWLRPSWLLLLHLIILALLLGALGRPALEAEGPTPPRAVLLIDRSASMAAPSGEDGRTRLDDALARASELAGGFIDAGAEVVVVAFDAEPTMVGRPTRSRSEARRQIGLITPSDRPGDPSAALRLAETLVPGASGEDDQEARPTVVLLSDGGDTVGAELALAGASFRYERTAGARPARNTGLVDLSGVRDRDDPVLARVFFRAINTGSEPIVVPATVSLDGTTVQRLAIELPAATDGRPGQTARTIEVRAPSASVVLVSLEAEDDLAADNAAGVALPAPTSPAVLLVAPADADGAPAPDGFLLDVLEALGLRRLQIVDAAGYERNAADPGGADLVVFDRVRPGAAPLRPSLSFGGGLPGVGTPPGDQSGARTAVLSWRRTHPTLRDVALDSVIVGRRLALPESGDDQAGRVSVLATGADGPLIVEAELAGRTHVVVGFAVGQSNWAVQVGFAIFVAQAVEHLSPSGGGATGRVFTTGQPVRLRARPDGRRPKLDGPERIEGRVSGLLAEFGRPQRAGLYDVRDAGESFSTIPVGVLSSRESALASPEAVFVAGGAVRDADGAGAGPRELWKIFLLAALVLLSAEWMVYSLAVRV